MERILLVIDNLEFGGGERVFLQLAAGLRDRFEILLLLGHHIEQHDHNQRDDQPEREIFIKLVHMYPLRLKTP